MVVFKLLGPPELEKFRNSLETKQTPLAMEIISENPSASLLSNDPSVGPTKNSPTQASGNTSASFADHMDNLYNKVASDIASEQTIKGLTENNSATFLSTGNPCLDFFFHIVPNTPHETLVKRLELSWAHDPLTTLKLVCNLRGGRGTGKSDRESFYSAALWLYTNHPQTLVANIPAIADFGYFKDLPEILYRLMEGASVRQDQKKEWSVTKGLAIINGIKKRRQAQKEANAKKAKSGENKAENVGTEEKNIEEKESEEKEKSVDEKKSEKTKVEDSTEDKIEEITEKIRKELGHTERQRRKLMAAKKLIDQYNSNANFQCLHNRVSEHFAVCLKQDLDNLKANKLTKISLAAKWCPSLDHSYDRSTLLCESIAKRIFPQEDEAQVNEVQYAFRVREQLRKQVLVPLRKALELPEVFMSANEWNTLPYNRVASVAMKLNKDKFLKHDKDRFEAYLGDVASGKKTIAAGALLPHEIIGCLEETKEGEVQVAELQWKRLVDDMLKKGKMKNSLSVCDVSGSMDGTPMEVSVALGLLVSELTEEPWKGRVITFSEEPKLHLIEGDTLSEKTKFVREMDWGMNTNFQKVFDCILEVADRVKLEPERMVNRLFVFSDMEFDEASSNPWETDYEAIVRKFTEKGYGDAVPQIIFWNLRDSRAVPVPARQKGVALVSGFSKNLLTLFLDNEGELSPEEAMQSAIAGPEYQKLTVVD
uniref:Uncharacterized protein L728 n=1 Tax=Cacopsylla melanoneura TaxID=428564 RepID=A0A8D8SF10_9HEMI